MISLISSVGQSSNSLTDSCLIKVENSGSFINASHVEQCVKLKRNESLDCLQHVGNSGVFIKPSHIAACGLITNAAEVRCVGAYANSFFVTVKQIASCVGAK